MPSMLYMSSPINALLEGFYRDDVTIATLREKGDFGMGTFNNHDGELVAPDGRYFQPDLDAHARAAGDDLKTPFSTVCRFQPTLTEEISGPLSWEAFSAQLKTILPSDNMFTALHMRGRFRSVLTRSVPRTENYRPLSEATDHQKLRRFENVEGHLVGFYTPGFVPSVNVPGFHFHFIDQDFTAGGHLLNCEPEHLDVRLQVFLRMELRVGKRLE